MPVVDVIDDQAATRVLHVRQIDENTGIGIDAAQGNVLSGR
jgi:hypothetical protein